MTDFYFHTDSSFSNKAGQGRLFILSAPSGAGKTTLCASLLKHFPDMQLSISHTTRQPRQGEQNGVDYHFIDEDAFQKGIANNRWVEWARVHGNYYGTSTDFIENTISGGYDVLLDIDVQGAQQLFQRYPESIGIFIMPPSMEELRRRIVSRGGDAPQVVENRLTAAKAEMAQKDRYHHIVINDNFQNALEELIAIIAAYRSMGTGDVRPGVPR